MTYQCPVCAYPEMRRPPIDYYICPCCGVEFENDDCELSHADLRKIWINNGAPWFSDAQSPMQFEGPTKRTKVLRYHLIDANFIKAMAEVMTEGAELREHALGEDDWRKLPHTEEELLDHLEHHQNVVKSGVRHGQEIDVAEKKRQLAKVACNAMMAWYAVGEEK